MKISKYRDLQEIIMYTQNNLGRVPLIPLIELASGINRDLDQHITYAHHDFKDSKYITYNRYNRTEFINVIDKIHTLQTKIHGSITLTVSMFRALFTILSVDDTNTAYLAKCINLNRAAFETIAATDDDQETVEQLFKLYNSKATLNREKPLAYAVGIKGIKIDSKAADVILPNKK